MTTALKHFIVGSSLPACIITFVYNGMAFAKSGRPSSVPYEWFPIIVPLLFGVANAMMYIVGKNNPLVGRKWWFPFIVGAVTGLTFSIIGRYGFDLPKKIFGFTSQSTYKVHMYAPVLYALIFGYVITTLNKMFI